MSALKSKAPDVKVGNEMGNPMGWLLRRTKRVEELLAIPEVMDLAQRIVIHLEHYCEVEEVDEQELEVTVLRTQTLRYITLALGARECFACKGVGRLGQDANRLCPTCDGTGFR